MEILQFRAVVRARRFEKSCSFYGEILGLARLRRWEGAAGRGALFRAGPGVVEVQGRSPEDEQGGRDERYDYQGPDHKLVVTLVVPSAERAYERMLLRDRNIRGGLRTLEDGTLAFETHDPDGVKIVLKEEA